MSEILTLEQRKDWLKSFSDLKKRNRTYFFHAYDSKEKEIFDKKDKIFELENPEKLFFKYRKLDKDTIDNIKDDKIHIQNPRNFNDPYDCRGFKMSFSNDLTYRDIKSFFNDLKVPLFKKHWESKNKKQKSAIAKQCNRRDKLTEYLRIVFQIGADELFPDKYDLNEDPFVPGNEETYISCFSSTNKNILMWSHYSENHQGICIGYNYEMLKEILYPVSYQQEFGDINAAKIIKSTDWSYEQEWRVVINQQMADELKKKYETNRLNCLGGFKGCAIYLGSKFNKNSDKIVNGKLMEELVDIAKDKNIPIFQMKMRSDKFELYEEKYCS